MNHGDIIRVASFTHVPASGPLVSLNMKVANRKQVAVLMLLGEENKDGTEPLDIERRLNDLGWIKDPTLTDGSGK